MTQAPLPTTARLRLGCVPYLNARPLVHGLAEHESVALSEEVPALLARQVRSGELDAALVSAVELFRDPPLSWIPGPAITSHGPVQSIRLFVRGRVEDIDSVALDRSSLSASAMVRVVLAEFLGRTRVTFQDADARAPLHESTADAVLLIGDPALRANPTDRQVVDLGKLWTEHTGLPFVYAMWLCRPDLPAEPLQSWLATACESGMGQRAQMARLFARLVGMPPAFCVEYLLHSIGYEFGEQERAGLELFGRLAHAHGLVDRAELPPPVIG